MIPWRPAVRGTHRGAWSMLGYPGAMPGSDQVLILQPQHHVPNLLQQRTRPYALYLNFHCLSRTLVRQRVQRMGLPAMPSEKCRRFDIASPFTIENAAVTMLAASVTFAANVPVSMPASSKVAVVFLGNRRASGMATWSSRELHLAATTSCPQVAQCGRVQRQRGSKQ